MKIFNIEKEALEQIRRIVNRSVCDNPVAVLVDMADPDEYMNDIKHAIVEGIDQDDITRMATKKIEEVGGKLEYRLTIITFEKTELDTEYIIDMDGIFFFMSTEMREILADYSLAFNHCRFMLKNNINNNVSNSLLSLFKCQDELQRGL